ncbi:MAG: outer membrane protein assembly factor BamA, partial [Proteobacteria bacterium]|nr:outer membrane protein assembly factor BamA [Pseudomonadota bacterium]
EKVDISASPGSAPDKTNLQVNVTEQSTGDITFGAGYSTSSGILGDVSIQERNLLGKGQSLKLSLSLGTTASNIDLSFTEPYFLDRPLAAGFDIFKMTNARQSTTSYASSNLGFSLNAGWAYTEHTNQTIRYTLKQTNIYDIGYYASAAVQTQAGSSITSEISESLAWDTRDQRFNPTKGWVIRNTVALAGLAGDNYYFRTSVNASIYQKIIENVIFSLNATGGLVLPFNDTTLRLNNRFYLGGDSLPGWAVAGVGPRDSNSGDALGGKYFYTGMGELSFPLGLPEEIGVVGKAFVDVGSAWGAIQQTGVSILDSTLMRVGTGFGVQWSSPFGPIRVDYTIPLVKEPYDRTQNFRFSFGAKF